jgi:hypothetical protein
VTQAERERADYERARRPFMAQVRAEAARAGAEVAVGDDLAELTFYVPSNSADVIAHLRDRALALGAADQGFVSLRFFVRSSQPGESPKLAAEVTRGPDKRWTTFAR